MTDVHSSKVRSYNMSRIRSKDTKPEISVRKRLFAEGFRYRLHSKSLPGKPDMVFPKFKAALFIDGCFWHGHSGCRFFKLPATRQEWWSQKIRGNRVNDKTKRELLRNSGWRIIQVWECKLKKNNFERSIKRIIKELLSGR